VNIIYFSKNKKEKKMRCTIEKPLPNKILCRVCLVDFKWKNWNSNEKRVKCCVAV